VKTKEGSTYLTPTIGLAIVVIVRRGRGPFIWPAFGSRADPEGVGLRERGDDTNLKLTQWRYRQQADLVLRRNS
jgi:hypothetical protein